MSKYRVECETAQIGIDLQQNEPFQAFAFAKIALSPYSVWHFRR
jgi:hypothetical protein